MKNQIHQLVYVSEATKDFQSGELIELLDKAKANNSAHNITGNLLFNGGFFLQILEGAKSDIEALYAKIERDPRHHKVKLLYLEPADFRLFGHWSMNMINLNRSKPPDYLQLQELVNAAAQGKKIDRVPAPVKLLRVFRTRES